MADNTTEPAKELTPVEKFKKATDEYFAAIRAGDKKTAAQIHADNQLPYSVGNHS
jgi:hypothetical protein